MSRTSSYIYSFHLPVERRTVFELFANPLYLDLLTPSWFQLRPLSEVSGKLEVGAEISYQLRWRGLPFRWTSLLTDWQAPGGHLPDRLIARPDLRRILECRESRALPVLQVLQERGQLTSRTSPVTTTSEINYML